MKTLLIGLGALRANMERSQWLRAAVSALLKEKVERFAVKCLRAWTAFKQ